MPGSGIDRTRRVSASLVSVRISSDSSNPVRGDIRARIWPPQKRRRFFVHQFHVGTDEADASADAEGPLRGGLAARRQEEDGRNRADQWSSHG